MKFLILAAAIIMAVYAEQLYTEDELARMRDYSKKCEEMTTVDNDMILQMRKGNFIADEKLMDYLLCMLKKMKWMNADGTMDKENMKKMLSRSTVAMDAMRPCMEMDMTGMTGAETAFRMFRCYNENLPAGTKGTL